MVVADTHVWIWWIDDPKRLSTRARQALEREEQIGVSAISCWEVAMLVARGRLVLDRDSVTWLKQALAWPAITLLPLTPEVVVISAGLDKLPGDPANRIIVASAIDQDCVLITKDRPLREARVVRTLW